MAGLKDELRRSREQEKESWAAAADMRFEAVQRLLDALGDEDVHLDWEDRPTRAAMELLYAAGADQFIVGEVETAVALWEILLAVDEEDHMSVSVPLAFGYVELEDFDCLEEMLFSISSKTPEYHLLTLWAEYRRTGAWIATHCVRCAHAIRCGWRSFLPTSIPSMRSIWPIASRSAPHSVPRPVSCSLRRLRSGNVMPTS